jgi:hypothetical protein
LLLLIRRDPLLLIAALIAVVGLVGALVWDLTLQDNGHPGTEHNGVLGITIFIQAIIAFFGILNLEEPHATKVSPITKGGMRGAIAGALVVTYLALVIFHTMVEFASGQVLRDSLRDSFVNNFTSIVGLTIGFYFASETAMHAITVWKGKESGKGPQA